MKRALCTAAAAALAACAVLVPGMMAQGTAQSPASRPRPKSATKETYPASQVRAGERRFGVECGFCHGRDTSGGEGGSDLTRSELVAGDSRGDKIGPFLKAGFPDGMHVFTFSTADLTSITAFIHTQKTKFDAVGGGRQEVAPADLRTGNAQAGQAYFSGAGGCSVCHSAAGDLKGIAARFQGLALMQRLLYSSNGRPAPARPKLTVTLPSGETITGPLAVEDEFTVSINNPGGQRQVWEKSAVKYKVDDPMQAHFEQLGKYTDKDMHDVYAYLETLK